MSPFDEMQRAVDIVGTSPHPANKIAATVFGTDTDGQSFSIARTNCWPQSIATHIGTIVDIGDSSGTIHAETAAIFAAPITGGAALCVTDPFCPNCAKNIAEAGIKTIYIDHKGFDKDFAARRGSDFDSMSMRICERAGISVYEIRRKEQILTPIFVAPYNYQPHEDRPVQVEQLMAADAHHFDLLVAEKRAEHGTYRMACALAQDKKHGKFFSLTALAHPAVGYTIETDITALEQTDGKYSFMMEPMNRLLMNAARHGLRLVDGLIYSSQVPTSREQVNLAGAGITSILVGDSGKARDDAALHAMLQMTTAGIMEYRPLRMMA
ncbi:MAG: deoxycytidylate deaminase [Alphaproteobacteria bacterium]|nr:deoxycytidylate deaminase [Alphaproteobacteria bacterium]